MTRLYFIIHIIMYPDMFQIIQLVMLDGNCASALLAVCTGCLKSCSPNPIDISTNVTLPCFSANTHTWWSIEYFY
ncbi:hypothetical protein PFLUV_G00119960 [Perca fluviatilis]|uniref:Uncharacterized protein n=1 Tax=Perca fluviatilis TaxID=8168 RepID=A0A6A5E629_PERFL|nr:hypothetical protein PFLUV_G00119960 [Perca fluviatilis]